MHFFLWKCFSYNILMKLCICLRISLSSNLFCLKTQTWTNNDLENQCILHMKMIFSVQSLSCVWLFENPWTVACLASLSFANPQSLLKLMSIESVMPPNRLIPCCPPLLLPSFFPSIRVFSNESVLHIRWPKYWSFSFSISPSNEYSVLISFRIDWFDLLAVQNLIYLQSK